jgi:hypothetical protein
MNANPASAASVGVSPNGEKLQGTPALQSTVVRAPEPRAALPRSKRSTSTAFRSTLVAPARRSLLR